MTSLIRDDLPQPANTQTKITAERVRQLYDEGTRAIRNDTLVYQENSCFIEGDQYIFRHSGRQEILPIPRRHPDQVQGKVPRIGPESRRIFSKLLKRPLVFEVAPDAPDDATITGARKAEGVLESKCREQKWNNLREEAAWAAWKGGTAGLCLDWDTSAGRYIGEGSRGQGLNQGDIKISALAITEMCTEPGTRDIERACWWIKAQVLPPPEAKKLYGLAKMPPANANAANSPMQLKLSRGSGGGQMPLNLTLVMTYYERPNNENKNGLVVTVIGDEIVDGPHDWPFPFKDRLNVVCLRETMVEGRWTGRTIVSDAVPVQVLLNHAHTSVTEHMKKAGNARVQGNKAEQPNAEAWTDEPGEFIFYDVEPFAWMSPTPMPDWWSRLPQMYEAAMDDIIGVHDISRGEAPRNIESGSGLAILVEQDDTPTGKFAQQIAEAWSEIATMVLQTYEVKVPPEEQRSARIDNPGYAAETFTWSGVDFQGQTIARVPYEAVAPVNEAARYAQLQFYVNSGLITTARQASKFLDIPGLSGSEFIIAIDPQVNKAREENHLLAMGEAEIPADFDDHALHIEEHNAFRSSGKYRRLPDDIRKIVDLHVQAHSTMAAEEAANQMLKMQFAPALGAAAQASQPPGSAQPMPEQVGQPSAMGQMMGGDVPPQDEQPQEPMQ